MEKPKLQIALKRVRNIVVGYVVSQDESLRFSGSGLSIKLWISSDSKFRMGSFQEPELSIQTLYLCGVYRDCDKRWFGYAAKAEAEAKQICAYIREGVAAINAGPEKETPTLSQGMELIE